MNKLIPDELRQALINYLARKPYHEVYDLIPQLEQLKPDGEAKKES